MRRNHITVVLVTILLLGFTARVVSLQWNWFMHSDVADDAIVTVSLQRDGRFSSYNITSVADPAHYPAIPTIDAKPIVMHGPVWPGLGAALTMLRGGEATISDGFLSLRMLSVVVGTLIILLCFLIASRLFSPTAGLAVAAWTAASAILIDYSGNGAQYGLQALLFLTWAYVAIHPSSLRRNLLLGLIAGIGYLNNFQAVILVPAGVFVCAMEAKSWKSFAGLAAAYVLAVGLVIAPWLVRSQMLFGDPFFSHAYNLGYPYGKAGITIPDPTQPYVSLRDKLGMLHAVVTLWTPNNLYYAARKLFILAPFAFFLFAYGLIDLLFSRARFRKIFPLLILLALQAFMYAGWPIWKFRFFVPFLPFVFLLSLEQLHHLPVSLRWKQACIGVTTVCVLVLSIMTFRAVPTHTYYYDGALTQDPFHSSEEETYLRRHGLLPAPDAE